MDEQNTQRTTTEAAKAKAKARATARHLTKAVKTFDHYANYMGEPGRRQLEAHITNLVMETINE